MGPSMRNFNGKYFIICSYIHTSNRYEISTINLWIGTYSRIKTVSEKWEVVYDTMNECSAINFFTQLFYEIKSNQNMTTDSHFVRQIVCISFTAVVRFGFIEEILCWPHIYKLCNLAYLYAYLLKIYIVPFL